MSVTDWCHIDTLTLALLIMAHKFSEKELKDLRTCYEDADADGSGSIDKREMKKMLKKLGCYTTGRAE